MKLISAAISVLFLLSPTSAHADDTGCSSYLLQDIHNKLVVVDNSTGLQVSSSSLCSTESKSNSSGFSIQYAGVGVGFDQASALANAMCDNKYSQEDFSSSQSVYKSFVDPAIVQASLECFKLNSKGLHSVVHPDADTHSVTITMTYNGPTPINVSDIVLVGNVACQGNFFDNWKKDHDGKVALDTKEVGITCSPKDPIDPNASSDIKSGYINIITDAGPVYAQVPRRFSPSFEDKFQNLEAVVNSLGAQSKEHDNKLENRVLAGATIVKGQIVYISKGASLNLTNGRFDFSNPENISFTPIVSAISAAGTYLTESCYARSVDAKGFFLWQGAQDTSGRNHPPLNCTVSVIGMDTR